MKLIDNRYKIDKLLEDSLYSSIFEVIDFWNKDKKLIMKLYNEDKQKQVIKYLINNFIWLSSIKHENLLTSDQFSIINTIDGKKVNIRQYYSTSEYVDSPTIDKNYNNLNFKERLIIILQACTVLDFLHYRGIIYKYLSPSNIFLVEDNTIKIMDLLTIYERTINTDYDDLTRHFIAPEVILGHEKMIDKNADKYSLGMLMIYLLTEDFYTGNNKNFNYINESNLDDEQIKFLDNIITTLIKKNPNARIYKLREIIDNIKIFFDIDYEYNSLNKRDTLNFNTKIIGREKEINQVLKIDEEIISSKDCKKVVLIKGNSGVGKTKFLKEISYLLKMRGRDVYYTEIVEQDKIDIKPMTNILRQTIKDTPRYILEKYTKELVRVLPELKYFLDMESFNSIKRDKERLRLYDRITNYLEEISRDKPIYIILDNIENGSIEFLFLLDYLINNIRKGKIILIASLNKKILSKNFTKNEIIEKWIGRQYIETAVINNLNLCEIGEYIQHILGINYKSLEFAAFMLKETQGNPKHIEYMIKDLYLAGELFLCKEGYWKIKTQKYSDTYFPSNIDETIKNQLNLIKEEHMDIMEIISICNGSISKNILFKILDMDTNIINEKLEDLILMRLLDEGIEDWGYNYSINNIQLKKLIFYQIPEEKRAKLHRKIAQLLEDAYIGNNKLIFDELIYHLIYSNQTNKALDFMVKEAIEDTNILNIKVKNLWEEAYEISRDIEYESKFKILENLGRIYSLEGDNDKAIKIYGKLFNEGEVKNKIEYTIRARIGVAEIYLKRNLINLALEIAKEALELSNKNSYLAGIVDSQILYNKILLHYGKLEEAAMNLKVLLEFAAKNQLNNYLGNIYNMIGVLEYYKGNIENSLLKYEESIKYFSQLEQYIESTKPINNIANIYSAFGNFQKAMEYYNKGLHIVEKYGILNMKLILLNNIGTVYMRYHDYQKAIEYIDEARVIAMDIEDANMLLLTNINLGLINLLKGDYEQSYYYYTALKGNYFNTQSYNFEVIYSYYNYLGEFYYTFGEWDEAFEYSQKVIELCKKHSNIEYLMSKTRIILIKYFKDRLYTKDSIEDIRREFRNNNLGYDRRKALLYLSIIPFTEGDYEYVLDLLKEDSKLKENFPTPSFNYLRKILLYNSTNEPNSYDNIKKLEEEMKKHHLLYIDLYANSVVGFKYYAEGKYYKAINYLLEALDLIYRLIKNIPDKNLQVKFIKRQGGDIIKYKLIESIYSICNKRIDSPYTGDLHCEEDFHKYFDYKPLLNLMSEKDFIKITEDSYFYDEIKDINNIETLISELTNDYKYNLKLILKFLAKETFAGRGYILVYDEINNKHIPIVSLNNDKDWTPNENLLALASRHEKGITINNNFRDKVIGLYKEFLPKGTKALICIPIKVKNNNIHVKKNRRKNKSFIDYKTEGFIYLETAKVFNRFDETRHKLVSVVSQIAYMNIENYKLKTLSAIDKLTGTFTRKYFEKEFNNILNNAKNSGETFAILMLDLDRFKNVNDTYGHRKGDEVLCIIGNSIINNVRNTDLVGRYGGEEFIVILRNVSEIEAIKIGEKIRKNISDIRISKLKNPITISVGISMFPKHSQFKDELVEKADQALYRAKEKGRNLVVVWDSKWNNILKRGDKLAGILSGNTNTDQRNVLAMLDIIYLINEKNTKEDKIYRFLGRLIEIFEAESSALIEVNSKNEITNTYSRYRLIHEWVKNIHINYDIVKRVIDSQNGEFLIDWDSVKEIDILLSKPNWQSIMALPLINNGRIKGVAYITVPIKEREYEYNSYNLAKVLCGIFSAVL